MFQKFIIWHALGKARRIWNHLLVLEMKWHRST
jgi:hypothetical protein